MRLSIRHRTAYAYDPPALRLALRLRLWPSVYDTQAVPQWRVTVNGEEVRPLLTDAFGDRIGLWHAHLGADGAEVIAEGIVETRDAAGVARGLDRGRALGVFLRDTDLTRPEPALRELARSAREAAGGGGPLAELHALQAAVREAVDYRSGVTDSATTAARALALGSGVCQDHAHVFIAAARLLGAPARYVAGYLLIDEAEQAAAAEDAEAEPVAAEPNETHAWAEAHVAGLGWIGFDAANGVCPTDRYVRLCSGLDAREAAPIRGHVSGATKETLEARVEIAAVDDASDEGAPPRAQAQTQQ